MTTAAPAFVPIPSHPDVDGDLQRSATLRLADILRDAGLSTGLVIRVLPFGRPTAPGTAGDRRTVQIVRDGIVLRSFTPEQVLHAQPSVLLWSLRIVL